MPCPTLRRTDLVRLSSCTTNLPNLAADGGYRRISLPPSPKPRAGTSGSANWGGNGLRQRNLSGVVCSQAPSRRSSHVVQNAS